MGLRQSDLVLADPYLHILRLVEVCSGYLAVRANKFLCLSSLFRFFLFIFVFILFFYLCIFSLSSAYYLTLLPLVVLFVFHSFGVVAHLATF